MLTPKKVKYRKMFKGRRRGKGIATRATEVSFGSFGLKSMDHAWITSRQIEATRRVLVRYLRKGGKIWIRIFPDRPVTKKGSEVPMGGGKGSPDYYAATVRPGTVMFEMGGISEESAREALEAGAHKLPVKSRFIKKI